MQGDDSSSAMASKSLREEGNAFFKAGKYLKAAAVYTQAIKADPSNAALYSNRSAAFLNLLKVTKALSDAEMAVQLNPTWEKGYFRKGCALEAMEHYDEALLAYREALEQNPKSVEVATKIRRLSQLVRDKRRAQEKSGSAKMTDGATVGAVLEQLKTELAKVDHLESDSIEVHTFFKNIIESSINDYINSECKLQARVHFLVGKIDKDLNDSLQVVTVEKAFESPDTLSSCVTFLRQHAIDTLARAACLVVSKKSIAFPRVWDGQGIRAWKHGQEDGLFVQLESSFLRQLWFVPCTVEKGKYICRDFQRLDLDFHAILPPLFR
ncbi:hypothetical protein O6H91_09G037500 [Diphasiastrum complanatum]|uniref:Uncharacterized protein n=2 Tax=Diphasiastrum complanatum TaxID=34168 RepID=A0ACC2CN11_DIPCM|nr:hypothetical protein O6H91_09G037500 [Diphasiastrum complanatum]